MQILINCVGIALGRTIDVNPKKIVAGHEPEKTNGLFQAVHEAATGDPERAAQAVQQALAGEKPGEGAAVPPPKSKPAKRPQSRGQNAEGSERPKQRAQPPPPVRPQHTP